MPIGGNSIISFGSTGSGESATTPEDIVREKLKLLLMTNKGDIVASPEFGCDLIHFVHAPLDGRSKAAMQMTILAEISQNMPYVYVRSIEFPESEILGALEVVINYELAEGYADSVSVILGGA